MNEPNTHAKPRPKEPVPAYVSRGAHKLAHALHAFMIDPAGLRCADLGCSTGGFTDVLLRAGAGHVTAVDTGYGVLDYRLRVDERVRVVERANALHTEPQSNSQRVDMVVVDLGWTPQKLAVPAALKWLRPAATSRIVTLVKPHYEADKSGKAHLLQNGVLSDKDALAMTAATLDAMPEWGAIPLAVTQSPIKGSASRKKKRPAGGNAEWLALLAPTGNPTKNR